MAKVAPKKGKTATSMPASQPVDTDLRGRLKAVTAFLPIFEAITPDDFAHLVGSSETGPRPVIGHLEYHPAVYEFTEVCYANGLVLGFDWGAWSYRARRYMENPNLVKAASLETCLKLLTTHLRAERFCDGHLAEVLRSGHITAVLRRFQQFA
jgi:hypothetical protein